MAPSGLFYLWIFLSYTIGILGSLCILLRSYMCSQHSIFSQSWLIMIGKDIFQNENGIFIRILTSSLLISVDIKYGRDLSDDHPNNARCFNLYRWQSLLSAVTWTANSIFCHLEWKNSYTEKQKKTKILLKQ